MTDEDAGSLITRFDGLVLMGGADVDPSLYGQGANPYIYGVWPEQAALESALLRAALQVGVRLLDGEDRATWWERAVAAYSDYQSSTDRVIPVFHATPRG